ANLNADLCARAFHHGDAAALEAAVTIRKLFEGKPLVPGIKSLLGHIHGDQAWAQVMPPLAAFSATNRAAVVAGYDQVRGRGGGCGAGVRFGARVIRTVGQVSGSRFGMIARPPPRAPGHERVPRAR